MFDSDKFLQLSTDGRIYVIGDIHGTLDETECLVKHLEKKEKLTSEDYVIFVGDYIDRGYDSKGVVDLLLSFNQEYSNIYFLKGNHEVMLLDYFGDYGTMGKSFMKNGGSQTLVSYDLNPEMDRLQVKEQMPETHLHFYRNLKHLIQINDYIIVHAGLDPLRDLEFQNEEDLFWIRDEFIMSPHEFEKTIVFGHTPFKQIFLEWPLKLGIDTGLVYGNILTCVELKEKKLIQVRSGTKKVIESNLAI